MEKSLGGKEAVAEKTRETQKHARTILDAISLHSQLEEEIQELFDGDWETQKAKDYDSTFDHIGFDTYDSSIELYVRDDAVFDQRALMTLLTKYGFVYGWINFDDGTEIHFGSNGCNQRTKKEHPHWTKEWASKTNVARFDHFLGISRPVLRRLITNQLAAPSVSDGGSNHASRVSSENPLSPDTERQQVSGLPEEEINIVKGIKVDKQGNVGIGS